MCAGGHLISTWRGAICAMLKRKTEMITATTRGGAKRLMLGPVCLRVGVGVVMDGTEPAVGGATLGLAGEQMGANHDGSQSAAGVLRR